MQRMRCRRHDVVMFQVMHHDELAFEFSGMIKFLGLEVPEELLAQPEDLRRGYRKAVERFNTRSRKSGNTTASNGSSSTPAATWAKCSSIISTSAGS